MIFDLEHPKPCNYNAEHDRKCFALSSGNRTRRALGCDGQQEKTTNWSFNSWLGVEPPMSPTPKGSMLHVSGKNNKLESEMARHAKPWRFTASTCPCSGLAFRFLAAGTFARLNLGPNTDRLFQVQRKIKSVDLSFRIHQDSCFEDRSAPKTSDPPTSPERTRREN